MKSFVLAAGLATLMTGAALAQTSTTTTTGGAMAPATATDDPATAAAGGPFLHGSGAGRGQMAMSHLASDLDDKDVYGANNEKIGEIEDFVINSTAPSRRP